MYIHGPTPNSEVSLFAGGLDQPRKLDKLESHPTSVDFSRLCLKLVNGHGAVISSEPGPKLFVRGESNRFSSQYAVLL